LYIDRRDPCKIEIPAGGRVEICDMHQAHPYRAVMEYSAASSLTLSMSLR
jgi:hypothetical protein